MRIAPAFPLLAVLILARSARGDGPPERSTARSLSDDTVRLCIAASTEGQTRRLQGKLLAAREQMLACARDACPPIVRSHCARWLGELDARIPSLVIRAEDAAGRDLIDARVTIDGTPGKLDGHPVSLDPGAHTIAIEARGGARREETILVAEGESSRLIALRLPSPAASAPEGTPGAESPPHPGAPTRRIPFGAWIVGGAGVLSLGAATYFALAASSDLNQLMRTCSPHCADADTRPGRTNAFLFDTFLGVGVAAVGAAVVWALVFPTVRDPAASASPRLEVRPVAGGAVTALTMAY
jgi:hypothetical protein